MRKLVLALAAAFGTVAAAHAGGSHGSMNHGAMTEGVHATGVLNSVADGSVNVSHDPIPDIGWPAMTMDLSVVEGADLGGAQPGDPVMIMLQKGDDGMYAVSGMSKQ